MKYLKKFNESIVKIDGESKEHRFKNLQHVGDDIHSDGKISMFQQDWFEKLLPDTLTVYSQQNLKKLNKNLTLSDLDSNNEYNFDKNDCTIDNNLIQFNYYRDNMRLEKGDIINGEPDLLEFDIHFVKNTRGIKLLVDITYGDQVISEFSIESPNKINIIHYNGIGSKYDEHTHWGFTDESIEHLVKFFNAFNHGIKITSDDLSFIDKHDNSYTHNINDTDHLYNDKSDLIEFENSMDKDIFLIINNTKPPKNKYLPKVEKYLTVRNIPYKVASTPEEVEKYNSDYNIIGSLSTGSDFSIINPDSDSEFETSETALRLLNCPILAMCYGFQSMAKFYGQNLNGGDLKCNFFNLTDYDKDHFLFKNIDLDNQKVSFCFHDYPVEVPSGFKVISMLDNIISGISNDDLKRYGILFHPEETEETYVILDNFVNNCRIDKQPNKSFIKNFENFSKKY